MAKKQKTKVKPNLEDVSVKPEEIIERMIHASTQQNDIVLDMFNGSGTTGVVCARNKRNYIGIESDKSYCELSRKRIKSAQSKNYER